MATVNFAETLNVQLDSWLDLPATVEIRTKDKRIQVRRISGWAIVMKITGERSRPDEQFKPVEEIEIAGTSCNFLISNSRLAFRVQRDIEEAYQTADLDEVKEVSVTIKTS